jgi:hypothetical protein
MIYIDFSISNGNPSKLPIGPQHTLLLQIQIDLMHHSDRPSHPEATATASLDSPCRHALSMASNIAANGTFP